MLLTTTGQMLFTMALFGVVAGALLLIAIAVDDPDQGRPWMLPTNVRPHITHQLVTGVE